MTAPRLCTSCRYWSDLDADMVDGVLVARCLENQSDRHGQMTPQTGSCRRYEAGEPIDSPVECDTLPKHDFA